jgi:hypothetical protein
VAGALSCSSGKWTGKPTKYTTEWLRNAITIAGATHRTLRLGASVKGAHVACEVTARNPEGFAVATSKAVRIAAAKRKR